MDERCDPEKLYERKFPNRDLPLEECKQCLFNIICLDYSTYDEDEEHKQALKDCEK